MHGGVILRLDFKNNWMFMKQHATNQEDKNKYFLGLQPLSRQHRHLHHSIPDPLWEHRGTDAGLPQDAAPDVWGPGCAGNRDWGALGWHFNKTGAEVEEEQVGAVQSTTTHSLQSCKREIKMWITAVLAGAGLAAAAAWVGPDPLRLGSVPAAHLLAKYVMEQLNAAARRKIFLIYF